MSLEWIITGIILLSGMTAGGISLYVKRRKEARALSHLSLTDTEIQSDLTDFEEKDNEK